MAFKPSNNQDRVGVFVFEETRERLNRFKARLRKHEGSKQIYVDDVINELIDHYEATHPQLTEKQVEYA